MIPATIALIFVLLFAMFRRPREASIILGNVLLTSPFGGLAALLLTGTNFSVSSGVGFLALFGVSVQTGVILVAYINELRAEGRPLDAAICEAADLRLRPIMMTALVATLGLLPAAMSNGIGSDSQKPLAIVVVGGLISSLALSLFMLPLLYRLFAPTARVDARRALDEFEASGVATTQLLERAEVSYQAGGAFQILDLLDAYRAVWEARSQKLELEHSLADAEADLQCAAGLIVSFPALASR